MADIEQTSINEESESENEDEWEEMEDDESDNISIVCLFCEECFGNAENVWSHCVSEHDVNILRIKRMHRLDIHGCIKLINFIRKKAPSPENVRNASHPLPWESDEFLQPVLSNDGLLQYEFDDDSDEEITEQVNEMDHQEATVPYSQYLELKHRFHLLEDRALCAEENLAKAVQDINQLKDVAQSIFIQGHKGHSWSSTQCTGNNDIEAEDEAYFSSYGHFSIHEEMLKDKTRTESYRQFIWGNPGVFKDKVVLDIGCGTGILSMFAAKAGARHVIGVDQSDIIYQAMDIVRENGLENVITLVKGLVEEVTLPVDKVDVIISEWMGYFLLFESMLDTVLFSRDKWLKPTGCVYPDRCTMSLVALGCSRQRQQRLSFWDDVYGFKMTCMKKSVCREPAIEIVDPQDEISSHCIFKALDLMDCGRADLQFKSPFTLEILKEDKLSAFVTYFNIFFEKKCEKQITFGTSPSDSPTHWKQTVLFLEQPISVKQGQVLDGSLSCKKNLRDPRSLDITIDIVDRATHKELFRQSYILQ